MKTITLWQPWASLLAAGDKRIETRSWATSYRGPLAIHAATRSPRWALQLMGQPPFNVSALASRTYPLLPAGAIVAVADLADVVPITAANIPGEPELSFGDYAPGRYAWHLANVRMVSEPIPAKGSQGIWEWTPPEGWAGPSVPETWTAWPPLGPGYLPLFEGLQ
jgi:activating signal cointegrator 1